MAAITTDAELDRQVEQAKIPQAWYQAPEGWMQKPDFKRKEQIPGSTGKSGGLASMFKSKKYQWRWWVLDVSESPPRYLRYYRDQNSQSESGSVDLTTVQSIAVSRMSDAPPHAIDLNSPTRIYTMAADTREEMLKWVGVLRQVSAGKYSPHDGEERETALVGAHKGEEFTVEFTEEESLFMSLEGLSTYTIIVTGFVKKPDGGVGQAEASGKIKVDDYLIGVNDTDLEQLTFFDSIDQIKVAQWPKTLRFRRTAGDDQQDIEEKGWVLAREPGGDKFIRRFLQLRGSQLSYYKPAYGGRQQDPAGEIALGKLRKITQRHDKRSTDKLKLQVELELEDEGTWMLCMRDLPALEQWVTALGKERAGNAPTVEPLETIEPTLAQALDDAAHSGDLLKQSDLDPRRFARRFFVLTYDQGAGSAILTYHKERDSRQLAAIDLAQVASVQSLTVEGAADPDTSHRIQLDHRAPGGDSDAIDGSIVIASKDEATLAAWKEKIEAALSTLGSTAEIKPHVTMAEPAPEEDDGDEEADADEGEDIAKTTFNTFGSNSARVQGWMYKKGDVTTVGGVGIRNSTYRRRYFVLGQTELSYYRTHAQAEENSVPTGQIRLRSVTTVRWSNTSWRENGIDLVTPKRLYTIVAETDEEASTWMDAISEAVDMLDGTEAGAEDSALPPDEDAAQERLREEIKSNMQQGGTLQKLTGNRVTGLTTWKTRYFALSGAVLSYYATEEDVYNEDVDALGTINMRKVVGIKTSEHPEVEWNKGFEIEVGERTYVLMATSEDACTEWMVAACAATGKLELKQNAKGQWVSTNPKAQLTARMSTYGKGARASALRGGRRSSAMGRGGKRGSVGGRGRGRGKRGSVQRPMDITGMPEGHKEEAPAPAADDGTAAAAAAAAAEPPAVPPKPDAAAASGDGDGDGGAEESKGE